MTKPHILISCPVSNREWVISHYLEHLYNLIYDRKNISLYFIINNSKDNSEQIIKDFKELHNHEYNSITIDTYKTNKIIPQDQRTTKIRENHIYDHLSNLRNKILDYASTTNCDHLLSCDSDILIRPDTLNKLLSHSVDVCAGLIYNGFLFDPKHPYKYPNILRLKHDGTYEHVVNYFVKKAPQLLESKLLDIDATGAVILMSRNIFTNKKIRYSWHKQGEDLAYSETVREQGFKLWCDASCFNYHMMNQQMLDEHLSVK